jgi:hypothetical protein
MIDLFIVKRFAVEADLAAVANILQAMRKGMTIPPETTKAEETVLQGVTDSAVGFCN